MYSFTMVKSNPIFALTMQFLYPYFLWALVALTIPVIIHLFYFKRFKKVYFSNVRYLKEIKEETSNRNKIKELLILLSRLLAFACLIFAFAQPFIPKGEKIKQGLPLVSIFIDNSFSMTSEKEDIPLLDYAKEKALKIVDSYGEEGKFQIITHDLLENTSDCCQKKMLWPTLKKSGLLLWYSLFPKSLRGKTNCSKRRKEIKVFTTSLIFKKVFLTMKM
ncbi:MAG: BatA domain-containing protein [Saprospiraceae bacterium]|nr:BatA domain-containing protein [Saprospiraceae bacterium]